MREQTDTVSTPERLPFESPTMAAQDILAELSEVMGLTLTAAQRENGMTWLTGICATWHQQYVGQQPSIDPARFALLEASADELHRSFTRIMVTRPLNTTMSPQRRKAWDDAVEQAIILLAGFYATPSAVQKMERAFPLLAKLLDRLTNPKHHPRGSCSWCGCPMNQMHRIKSECPVSAAQGFQDELTASVQEP